ncbi:hypothetical protein [Staphylococcus carnosus]|uniref:hypothetical protein n=1 Tax=Staphylococcus carnosus TaxID=1281 RepID=UPI000A493435|nr:hypothetical protein [Staphylococcus carnosus]QQS85809.1 hypothetical protein I6J04_03155 [Staphylococcus carnosus]QRQ05746.1 hypothetical protein I6J34_03495 [Staphylococcus carnosus]SUM07568.1 Uncharacterised protein [Staphylococcus carnosus]
MKINIGGYDVRGTPEEIKNLINLVSQNSDKKDYEVIKSSFDKPKVLLCNKNFK